MSLHGNRIDIITAFRLFQDFHDLSGQNFIPHPTKLIKFRIPHIFLRNKTIKKYNPQALSNHQILSFSSTPIKKLTLTPEQKSNDFIITINIFTTNLA
jgi:hypothetical protein